METSIKVVIPTAKNFEFSTLFAYTTHGIPGIDIVGMGKYTKAVKEKLIYLCRCRKIKLPLKRFVLCLEQSEDILRLDWDELRWLEFPYFLLLLHLLELLPIHHLDGCLTAGTLNSDGVVSQFLFGHKILNSAQERNLSIIHSMSLSYDRMISLQNLLIHVPYIKIK